MIVIIVSFAFGSVAVGVLLGKLLKRAANLGTVELRSERGVRQGERYTDVKTATPPGAGRLIPNSNET